MDAGGRLLRYMTDPLFARFGREFPAGEVLFREGESGEVMFVIQSGAVRISKEVGGEQKVLAVLGPGEFLGEMAILNGKPRTATATVMDTTRCLVIEAKTLEAMVAKNAEIAKKEDATASVFPWRSWRFNIV